MNTNFSVLEFIANNKEIDSVLATIIKVEGSSYRKEGAMMLCKRDGDFVGMLSAGCLEAELLEQTKKMLATNDVKAKVVRYDMSSEHDLGWGRGAGCNGAITILLEKVDANFRDEIK